MSVVEQISRIKTAKDDIKNIINSDFTVINDEKIDSYPGLIESAIEQYKGYIQTQTAKGELVHVTDALPLPTLGTKSSGNVYQFTTKGNQLYNYKDIELKTGVTVDEDGWITATYDNTNGTEGYYLNYSAIKNELLNVSQDYAVVLEIKSFTGTGTLAVDRWGQFKAAWVINSANLLPNKTYVKIMTTKDDFSVVNLCDSSNIYVSAGNKFSITYRISILEDTTVTPETFVYEKFTGGQASPNPNYKQPIEVLEGYNEFNSFIATKNKYQPSGELQIEKDGTFVVSGNTGSNNYFGLEETLGELCPGLKVGDTVYLNLETTSAVKSIYVSERWDNNQPKTITQKMLDTKVAIYGGYNQTDKIKVQVSKTPNKPYLPYEHIGYKITGKNKFNIGNITDYSPNTNLTISDNNISKTIDDGNGSYCVKNTKYYMNKLYISANYDRSGVTPRYIIRAFDSNGNQLTTSVNGWSYNAYYKGYYIDDDGYFELPTASYIQIGFVFKGTSKEIGTYSNIMLSETDNIYEPYKEQIVYLDLKGNWVGAINDNIKDYLVTDKKKYWLVKNVAKIVLDGSENWVLHSNSEDSYRYWLKDNSLENNFSNIFTNIVKRGEDNLLGNIFCTHFTQSLFSDTRIGTFSINTVDANYNRWFLLNVTETSPENLKTWLSNNNVEVLYPTAKTDTIYLGELPEPIKTFEGVNNIQVLANLDTEIEVTYYVDYKLSTSESTISEETTLTDETGHTEI